MERNSVGRVTPQTFTFGDETERDAKALQDRAASTRPADTPMASIFRW
jgi:hypothetical protein